MGVVMCDICLKNRNRKPQWSSLKSEPTHEKKISQVPTVFKLIQYMFSLRECP